MARLGCWFGVALMLLAFAALFSLVVLPVLGPFRDNAILMSLQAAISCPAGYTFENEFTTYRPSPGETIDAATGYCISPEGERIQQTADEQGSFIMVAMGSFAIPFVVGLLLFIFAVNAMTTRRVRTTFQTGNLPFGLNTNTRQSRDGNTSVTYVSATADQVDPKTAEWIKNTMGIDLDELQASGRLHQGDTPVIYTSNWHNNPSPDSSTSATPGSNSSTSLSERLKQIDDARAQGLLSLDEYDRLRKNILDDMA
jgi:hypothetical protein